MESIVRLALDTQALAVQEKLHFVRPVIVGPDIDSLSLFPVPVREKVKNRRVGPFALVHIIDIFRNTCQVDNTEETATARPPVRCRFTQIVEARPDKHT